MGREDLLSNRDRNVDAERRRMRKSGASLKKIGAFRAPKPKKKRRGGVRGEY